jgi:hypothetical protein
LTGTEQQVRIEVVRVLQEVLAEERGGVPAQAPNQLPPDQ